MIRINPIIKKDLKISARSMKICWSIVAYEGILVLIYLLALFVIEQEARYLSSNVYKLLTNIFPIIAVTQVCVVALIVPIMTASSISGERERQTFDIMLTTCMTPFSIVFGKVISAMAQVLFYVVASTPVMALAFVLGGLNWYTLFLFLFVILLFAFFAGSIGIFCSSLCRKTITSVIAAFGFYFIMFVGPFVPMIIWAIITATFGFAGNGSVGETLLPLLIDPVVYIEEFFTRSLSGSSLLNEVSSLNAVGKFSRWLMTGNRWLVVSTFFILGVSFFYLWLASRRINPLLGRKVPKQAKNQKVSA